MRASWVLFVAAGLPLVVTVACGGSGAPAVPLPAQEVVLASPAAPSASSASPSSASAPASASAAPSAVASNEDRVDLLHAADVQGGPLGITGTGGSGGTGEGIEAGIGLGTIGHGAGVGSGPPSQATLRQGSVTVRGKLPPEVVMRIVRQHFGRFRLCYEAGLRTKPRLGGVVAVTFAIARDGSVRTSAIDGSSTLSDPAVVACVLGVFPGLSFPQPEQGEVAVWYAIAFTPPPPSPPPASPAKPASSVKPAPSVKPASSRLGESRN
ncbi:MAG: AgmX/PglI C-terminal domain-containing protein [Myxococcales bacterium]|nr:AgmX/PglI C-terminal domain-containing protein [Myxococcales bacterium]